MIEMSLAAWLWFAAAVMLSSLLMVRVSAAFPWSDSAQRARLPFYVGLGLAPFAWGFAAVLTLLVADGASHTTHRAMLYGGMLLLNLLALRLPLPKAQPAAAYTRWEYIARALLVLFLVTMFFSSIFYALTQNDPLEYATVGRAIFNARSLSLYPLIDPTADASGFYGPWTHPPLYVAMIYSTELMQNHADMPGLMRLISPWVALTTVGVLYAMGNVVNRATGLFAGIIFLATPLYFFGATSAVIDMLAVQGFLLIVAAILGLRGSSKTVGPLVGVIAGMALWTHSQALLFLPLALVVLLAIYGLAQWRRIARLYALLLLVALVIAAWPYIHNMQYIGAFISDTPAVFALPVLDWNGYFRFNRGIDSLTAIIQYGVLKGWFTPLAFSASFWLMTVAMGYYFWRHMQWRTLRSMVIFGGGVAELMLPWLSLCILFAYLGGVVVSVAFGMDIMIRNERYMLVIMPFVALIGGWFMQLLLTKTQTRSARIFGSMIVIALSLHVVVFLCYATEKHEGRFREFIQPLNATLFNEDGYGTIAYMHDHIPEDAVVFSLRPSDMYYAQRRMVSYLDPRLLPFYEETDTVAAWRLLLAMGIDYVHVPDYPLPIFYNSALQSIVADPSLTALESISEGYQVYRLYHQRKTILPAKKVLALEEMPWTSISQWIVGGRKPLYRIGAKRQPFHLGERSVGHKAMHLWQRDFSTLLQTGDTAISARDDVLIPVQPDTEYSIDFTIDGYGYVEMFLIEYDQDYHQIRTRKGMFGSQRIGGTVLTKAASKRLVKRIRTSPTAHHLTLGLEHYGNSTLKIEQGSVNTLAGK